jgi:hypothetical protein
LSLLYEKAEYSTRAVRTTSCLVRNRQLSTMSEAQGNIDDARPWISKAERDLLTAERLLALGVEEVLDAICFEAQQSSEKHLKASTWFASPELMI